MKIVVNRKKMLGSLLIGGGMSGKCKSLSILNCVKITIKGNNMIISSYDSKNSITKIFSVDKSEGDIKFCVDCKDLTSILKSVKDDTVTLSLDDMNINILHKKGAQSLPLDDVENFPQPNRDKAESFYTIDSSILHEIINTCRDFIQTNELRPQMSGLFLGIDNGVINFAATDGFSLCSDSIENQECEGVVQDAIISLEAVSPLLDMISNTPNVRFCISERNIIFQTDDSVLVSTKSEYAYPKYKNIIPKSHSIEIEVDKEEIIDTLSRVMLTTTREKCLVKMSTDGLYINVETRDELFSKKSKETLLCTRSGQDITIGVKGTYLKTCLDKIKDNTITMYMNGEKMPIVFHDNNHKDRVIMLMPMVV